jgi:hypothetical protein
MRVLTYTDCGQRLYLTMLVLELLRKYPAYSMLAVNYAKKTKDKDYARFNMSGTDLYNFVYFINGDDEAINKLKDPGAAKALRQRTYFPMLKFNGYLSKLSVGSATDRTDAETFIKIESALNITNSDYKAIRRAVFNWTGLSKGDRKAVVTKLLFASRAKLRSSDIIDELEKLAADKNLETDTVKDTEPTVSVPDIAPAGKELALYARLVGNKNVALLKSFLELAKEGKSVPNNMIKAYLPVIEMVDDIVKGGPSYIQLLRTLQSRAKNDSKK